MEESAPTRAKAPITHPSFAANIEVSLRTSRVSSPDPPRSWAARRGSMFSGLLVNARPGRAALFVEGTVRTAFEAAPSPVDGPAPPVLRK